MWGEHWSLSSSVNDHAYALLCLTARTEIIIIIIIIIQHLYSAIVSYAGCRGACMMYMYTVFQTNDSKFDRFPASHCRTMSCCPTTWRLYRDHGLPWRHYMLYIGCSQWLKWKRGKHEVAEWTHLPLTSVPSLPNTSVFRPSHESLNSTKMHQIAPFLAIISPKIFFVGARPLSIPYPPGKETPRPLPYIPPPHSNACDQLRPSTRVDHFN